MLRTTSMRTSHTSSIPWWKRSVTQLTDLLPMEEEEKAREPLSPPCPLTRPCVLSSPTNMCQPGSLGLSPGQDHSEKEHSRTHTKGWRLKPHEALSTPPRGRT